MARSKVAHSEDGRKGSKKRTVQKRPNDSSDLKLQIQVLGGNVEEDYELLKDADSDGLEDENSLLRNPGLEQDVAKFMKALDFGSLKHAASSAGDGHSADSGHTGRGGAENGVSKAQERASKTEPDVSVAEAAAKAVANVRRSKTELVVPPGSQWYLAIPPLPTKAPLPPFSPEYLLSKSTLGASLLKQDADLYTQSSSHTTSTSDARFLTRVLESGTLSDRLSALTLMAQGSPVHNTRALESLRAMAGKKGREESLKAMRAIVDWWSGGGAPDRKLKYFHDQALTHPDVVDQHLVLWYFEDWLKKYFFSILQLLETLSLDPLPYVRTQAMSLIFQLLRDKPEQEQNLLRLLVHKLGDSERSVASKASYYLLQLLQTHPQMKEIIIHEVSALILKPRVPPPVTIPEASVSRPGENQHARYYAVITFNQIVLIPGDKDVAARLVDVYFELFKTLLGEDPVKAEGAPESELRDHTPKQRRVFKGKGSKSIQKDQKDKGKAVGLGFQEVPDSNSKLLSAILTGVNRALPFVKTENSAIFDQHINTLFRITHSATFSVSLQALSLIEQVASRNGRVSIADRFYRTLYASLLDPRLAATAKQAMYLNLLFKAVKMDKNHARVEAFVKRIVQILSMHQPAFICGGLYLLGELFSTAPNVRNSTMLGRGMYVDQPYDPRKRDPQYAYAESACLWELLPLLQHYHPSVALHARQLLNHTQVTATVDLGLNTLSHFLDRFVYRNAKKARPKGVSAMQPTLDGSDGKVRSVKADNVIAVNKEGFRRQAVDDVPADQLFFHKYFSKKHDREQARTGKAERRKGKRKEDLDGSDDEVVNRSGSDAEEAEIWKAMQHSVPGLGGDDDDSLSPMPGGQTEEAASFDSDGSDMDFIEDEDDLNNVDENVDGDTPIDLVYPSGSESDRAEDEWEGFGAELRKKRVRDMGDGVEKKIKRRKLALSTFASYEDYAAMIEGAKEDDI